MIPFKVNNKETIFIPSSFEDLTFKQVISLGKESTEQEIIKNLTGLDKEQASEIIPYLQFLNEKFDFEQIEQKDFLQYKGNLFKIPTVRACTWAQKILFSNLLEESKKQNKLNENLTKLLSFYMQPIIDEKKFKIKKVELLAIELENESFINIFSATKNLINQFYALFEYESKALKKKQTPEQIQAGIKMFDQLGDFNTLDLIASGDVLKYEEVLKIDYNTILNKLIKMKLTSTFEENLRNILKNKK